MRTASLVMTLMLAGTAAQAEDLLSGLTAPEQALEVAAPWEDGATAPRLLGPLDRGLGEPEAEPAPTAAILPREG